MMTQFSIPSKWVLDSDAEKRSWSRLKAVAMAGSEPFDNREDGTRRRRGKKIIAISIAERGAKNKIIGESLMNMR